MPEINWTKKASKQIAKIADNDSNAIEDAVEELAKWPNIPHLKVEKLTDDKEKRSKLVVGNYRVIWKVEKGKMVVISILEVLRRTTTTYKKR
ncbi:type II toxin-antitoxin system RelE family toxin [Rosenbergiella collisarenosi]|uniref:type II toxin-antitoxin system RelE family toxin n=1 Tax=Rosenbergiella collisarenosi TaxID=1544695 RepID=UPI001F4DFC62|nr:type II toxin-antitoxin system RelE/ParE family toxin [Rosenbergiella collisarenosi]